MTEQKAQLPKSKGQEDSRASNLLTFNFNPLLTLKSKFLLNSRNGSFLLKLMIQKFNYTYTRHYNVWHNLSH